jgi:hypothetical protein
VEGTVIYCLESYQNNKHTVKKNKVKVKFYCASHEGLWGKVGSLVEKGFNSSVLPEVQSSSKGMSSKKFRLFFT